MTRAVLRKELAVLWTSPVPWVVGAVFHLALGLLYVNELAVRRQALAQPMFPLAGFLLLATLPLLTMRAFAEEARLGTLDLLQAIPVPTTPLVVGKWLAAWLTSLAVVAPSLLLLVLVELWGEPDPGPVLAGYLGLALLAAAASAIGVLTSSTTESQPVAAVVAFFSLLILWFAHAGSERLAAGGLLAHFSVSERLRSFAGGAIDSGDVGFLVVLTVAALAVAGFLLDARRMR